MSFIKYLGRVFGIIKPPEYVDHLYAEIVKQARLTIFYTDFNVPDSVAGRFDLIALHAYIVMRRLKILGEEGTETSQHLFDVMFTDMDRNMREMGVGDLGVGKKVKSLAKSFYGRIKAYDEGVEQGDDVLIAALRRNLYGDTEPGTSRLTAMKDYVKKEIERSGNWKLDEIITGNIQFGKLKSQASESDEGNNN